MAVYFITGKLGGGKSLVAVGKIRDYLAAGRRVATNLDIYLEHMMPRDSRATVHRLPDKPRVEDLEAMGLGYDGPEDDYREDRFGALVLDELGTWFNSRTWNDRERLKVIDWFLHARKYRWDVYLIVQDIGIIDKQLRDSLCEHLVVCRRLDRLSVPILSPLTKLLTGHRLTLPRLHVASVYYGDSEASIRVERWIYRGTDLYQAYRTRQVFVHDQLFRADGSVVDMRAASTTLSAWHLRGRYHVRRPFGQRVALLLLSLIWPALELLARVSGRSPEALAQSTGLVRRKRKPQPVKCGPARPALLG